MEPVNILQLASRHSGWLAVRQSVVAGNVANAATPGFKAREVSDFGDALTSAGVTMQATHVLHIRGAGGETGRHDISASQTWETRHSGNSVRLEEELMKASSVNRAMQLNTGVAQAFHRMLATAVRG